MKIFETVNNAISYERAHELGFKELTEITQGATIYTKGIFKKKKYQTWYIKIENSTFVYTYYFNSRGQSLKIMEQIENTIKNKEEIFKLLESAKFNKNIEMK